MLCMLPQIQLERRKVLMLQQRLDTASNQLGATRTAMGGLFSARDKSISLAKQIKILENRLEKAFVKFNEAITFKKALREQIDNLRRERLMFETIDASLDKELARIKRHIAGKGDGVVMATHRVAAVWAALSASLAPSDPFILAMC